MDEFKVSEKKKGGTYWTLTLRDRTGTITAKIWDAKSWVGGVPETNPRGTYLKVRAEASSYNDKTELTLRFVRLLNPATETVAVEDFVPVGPKDRFEVITRLRKEYEDIYHPGLRAVCLHVFNDAGMYQALRDAPAAKGNHHAYVGGLVDHITSLVGLSYAVASNYEHVLDEDLLVAACLFHDIGKIRELSWDKFLGYTVEGMVVGHVVIGLEILDTLRFIYFEAVDRAWGREHPAPDSTELHDHVAAHMEYIASARTKWNHLRHIVASHHGRLEWGAAKTPMTREAMVFHLCDMIDSRMGAFANSDEIPTDALGFTSWVRNLDGPVWRP